MFRVNQPKRRIYIIGFFIIGVIVGAGCFQLYNSVAAPNSAAPLSQDQTYLNAIEDAIVAKPSEVYSGLTPIVENNSNLVWQGTPGNESVLIVTWTKYASNYPVNGTVTTSWGETWVTTAPQIQLFFKEHVNSGVNATLRAAQLLGLPANTTDTYFVELWVNPQSLFRSSPDNEITDTTASLTFPANTTADYKAWFNNYIITAYYPMKYPWTRLGYTYDWGSTQTHMGLSEFVIKQNSTVTVKSVTPTAEFLGSHP
jgi:hypothetical protein